MTELADLVGVSRGYIHKLIESDVIRHVGRVGRSFRIPVQEAVKVAKAVGALQK